MKIMKFRAVDVNDRTMKSCPVSPIKDQFLTQKTFVQKSYGMNGWEDTTPRT